MSYIVILIIILISSAITVGIEAKSIIDKNEKMLLVAPISLFVLLIITGIVFAIFTSQSPLTFKEEIIAVFANIMFAIDFMVVGIQFLLMVCCTISEKKKIQKNRVQK